MQNQILMKRKKRIEETLNNRWLRKAHHENQPLQKEVMDLKEKEVQEEARIKGKPFLPSTSKNTRGEARKGADTVELLN